MAQHTPTVTMTYFVKKEIKAPPVVIRKSVIRPSQQQPAQLSVELEQPQHVSIKIYTVRGKLVKTVVDKMMSAGTFEQVWTGVNQNGSVVSSGVYIVHIKTDTFSEKRKIALVR